MINQLTLDVHLRDDANFKNFYPQHNEQVVTYLQQVIKQSNSFSHMYLWGSAGVGRTHLLQASCQLAAEQGGAVSYVPLQHWRQLSPAVLEGLESLKLICLDDIDAIANQPAWEEALFHLYNRLLASGVTLIVSANSAPAQLPIQLPDLTSRLAASVVFHIQALSDADKLAALQLHAKVRGMDLSDEAGEYLLRHCTRDMGNLCAVLDKLDKATLAAKRKLTVPFIKETL